MTVVVALVDVAALDVITMGLLRFLIMLVRKATCVDRVDISLISCTPMILF